LCVPVGVLGWQRSVAEGPLNFWVLVVASLARSSRGGACLAQGHVPCVPFVVALPLVFVTLLLLLPVASTCHADSSGLPGAKMWRLLPVVLDATSSRLRSRGAASCVHAMLLVSSPGLSPLFHFFLRFFPFVFELGAP
jgi:hypothetical protein